LAAVKFVTPPFRTDAKPEEPMATNFVMAFCQKIADRLQHLETYTPSPTHSPITNLALSEPSTLRLKDGYVTKSDDLHVTRFFLVGITANSSLFSGAHAHSLSVVFSGQTLPCAMAVLGGVFKRKHFIVSTFAGGISLSTYKRSQNSAASASSPTKLKVAPRSPTKQSSASKHVSIWEGIHRVYNIPNACMSPSFMQTPSFLAVRQWNEDGATPSNP
jgi:hypothetical protein